MLFGLLHRMAIVLIDLKETIIFMVLYSCQICKTNIFLFSVMRTTLRIRQWKDHSPWSVLLTLLHLPPLPQQQQQLLGRSWLLLVPRFLFQLPPQLRSLLLGLPVPFPGGSFYSTQQRTHVPAKRAQVEPPQKTPKTTSKESCGKGGKNKRGGGVKG